MEDPAKRTKISNLVIAALAAKTQQEREIQLRQLIGLFRDPHRFPLDSYSGYRDGTDLYTVFVLEAGVLIGQGVNGSFLFQTLEVFRRGEQHERIAELSRFHQATIATLKKHK